MDRRAEPRDEFESAKRGAAQRELELRAAICAQAQMLGRSPSDAAAECGEIERLRDLAAQWSETDEEISQWSAWGQPTVIHGLGAERRRDAAVTAMTLAEETVRGQPLTGTARERSRVICSYLGTLVRARCGLTDDQLIARIVEGVLGIQLGSVGDDLPSQEGDGDLLRAIKVEYEFNDAILHKEDMEVESRYSAESRSRLPAARARARRATVALADLRRSTCIDSTPRTRARPRGAGRPGRRRIRRAHAPPGDEASEGEPARGRRSSNDDLTARALA